MRRMRRDDKIQSAGMNRLYKGHSEDNGMTGQPNDPDTVYLTLQRVINAPVETVYADHELMGRERGCTDVHQRGMDPAGLCRPVPVAAVT